MKNVKDTKKAILDREYSRRKSEAYKRLPLVEQQLQQVQIQRDGHMRKWIASFEEILQHKRRIDLLESTLISVGILAILETAWILISII